MLREIFPKTGFGGSLFALLDVPIADLKDSIVSKTGTVTVTFPRRRKVYVNGNYTPSLPKTSPCTFAVEYGENVFETVNGDDRIDFRGSVTTNDANKDCDLELEPVVPPEPK